MSHSDFIMLTVTVCYYVGYWVGYRHGKRK